jgi:hypothetical protein
MKNNDPTFLEQLIILVFVAIVFVCTIMAIGGVIDYMDSNNVPGPSIIEM